MLNKYLLNKWLIIASLQGKNQWTPRSLSSNFLFQADILAQKTIHMVRRVRFIYFSRIVFPEAFLLSWLQYAVNLFLSPLTPSPPLSHTLTHRISSYLTASIWVCLENTVQTEHLPEMLYWQNSLSSCVYDEFTNRHAGCGPRNHVAYFGYDLPFE